jgi:hypothetical protein
MQKRIQNELNFGKWIETDRRGRIYFFEVKGKLGWKAKYLKEVDNNEVTIKFWQEIYNENDLLVEIHEKYPIDKGHIKTIIA